MSAHERRDDLLGAALIQRARNAIAGVLRLPAVAEAWHPWLTERSATFVTLHADGVLRGCIGRLVATRSLEEDVRAHAVAAAFHDTRFAPVVRDEFALLRVEVSVLGAAQPIAARSEQAAIAQLQPHLDGVILAWRGSSATFLPQVWASIADPAQFLAALKRKAGLPADFWAADMEVSRYRVIEYHEPGEQP